MPADPAATESPLPAVHYPTECWWNLQGYCVLRYLREHDPDEVTRICLGVPTAALDAEHCSCKPPPRAARRISKPRV